MGFMFYCQGILRSLQGSPYTLSIQPRLEEEDLLKLIKRIVDGQLADGLIIGQTRNDDSRVRHLQQQQFPFVTFGRTKNSLEPHPFYEMSDMNGLQKILFIDFPSLGTKELD